MLETMARKSDPQNGRVGTRSGSSVINLVSCSSEHLILAIKKGSVAKVTNIDVQGRPTLVFKELSSIYKCENANKMHSEQTFTWQANRSRGTSGDCQVKLEFTSEEESGNLGKSNNNVVVDDSENIFHMNDADLETNHDGDEINGMTLKELKIRWKKQKVMKSDVSGEADAKSHPHVFPHRQSEQASIEPVEVESDLEEPLAILKEKLSKKYKPERKRRKCTHLDSPDSVVSTIDLNEKKQSSSSNAAQSFISLDGKPPEHALFMDNIREFHLKNIKEEDADQTVVAVTGSIAEHNLPNSTMPQVSEEEAEGNESETRGLASSSSILDCSMNETLSSENDKLDIGINENAIEMCHDASSSMLEFVLCSIGSPEMDYSVNKEILEPDSSSEQAVTTDHCFAYDFTVKCHLPGKLSDEALDRNNECEVENMKPPPAEKSQCSHIDEGSMEHCLLNRQISLQESAEENFDVIESSFSPLVCSSNPVSSIADHGYEVSDSSESTSRVKEIVETFDPIKEQNNGTPCCRMEIDGKTGNSNVECKDNHNSTYGVPSQNIATGSTRIDCAKTNVSNDISSTKSKIFVSTDNKELTGEIHTDIPGRLHSPQTREHSESETHTTCASTNFSLLSSSTDCFRSVDACLDVMATVEEKWCHLKVHEEGGCSNGFLHPSDVEGFEAVERQKRLSQNCEQLATVDEILHADNSPQNIHGISTHLKGMFSNEGSNLSAEISSCKDADGHKKDEAIEYSLEHPPIKLLSNRKALSPTSQEKLCQAADAESDNVPISESGKKLLFDKRTNNSSPPELGHSVSDLRSSPERMKFSGTGKRLSFDKTVHCTSSESSHGVRELMLSPEKASKKLKNGSVPPTSKGILKSTFPSLKPCSCMESSLIRKQTQEAITFSQRQMHDIESLAMKLVKGLTSMKSVVEAALNSDACSSEPSKYNTDQMRIAIDNASELEDTTERWLSMMGRDCNRFCKILRSTIYKTPAPIDGLRKERKKITFADEAGGTLCHVKVFEGHTSSLVDSEHKEVDPFPQTFVQQLGN